MDIHCALIIAVVALGLVAMFLGYKAKFDKKGVELEKNDRIQAEKHKNNETRIKTLEEKNGSEQRQIDEQRKEINELKNTVIKLQEKIIRDGKHT